MSTVTKQMQNNSIIIIRIIL